MPFMRTTDRIYNANYLGHLGDATSDLINQTADTGSWSSGDVAKWLTVGTSLLSASSPLITTFVPTSAQAQYQQFVDVLNKNVNPVAPGLPPQPPPPSVPSGVPKTVDGFVMPAWAPWAALGAVGAFFVARMGMGGGRSSSRRNNPYRAGTRVRKTMGVRMSGTAVRPFSGKYTDGQYRAPTTRERVTHVRWDDGTRGWAHDALLRRNPTWGDRSEAYKGMSARGLSVSINPRRVRHKRRRRSIMKIRGKRRPVQGRMAMHARAGVTQRYTRRFRKNPLTRREAATLRVAERSQRFHARRYGRLGWPLESRYHRGAANGIRQAIATVGVKRKRRGR